MSGVQEYDVIIIGAGFSGVHQLIQLRKQGLKIKILEAGGGLGGTWYWNTYPGARVDSENPLYQFSDPELWHEWTYKEKFPGWEEIQEYFKFVDKKRDISKDVIFNSRVVSAHWDNAGSKWNITTEAGQVYRAQYISLCAGIAAKYYVPPYKGIDSFKGEIHHTSRWPKNANLKGKKIGVIGTGATGVQVIQETAPIAEHLTVFQRTPNMALPMRQEKLDSEEQAKLKKTLYPYQMARRQETFTGYLHDLDMKNSALQATEAERQLYFEDKWTKGGFHFWVGSYGEILLNQEVNDFAYTFWKNKVRERINDPKLQEALAPTTPPHPFGLKRPSLEQNYFEQYNRSNVTLVNLRENAIEEVTPTGVKTSDGVEHKLDVLVLATGFDMVTGSVTSIDIRGQDGVSIKEKWADGCKTYLGLGAAGFPNLFWIFGPHHPAAFSNAPSSVEPTSDWVAECIKYCRENNIKSITAAEEAQASWVDTMKAISQMGLYSKADSWYVGANIPVRLRYAIHESLSDGSTLIFRASRENCSNSLVASPPTKKQSETRKTTATSVGSPRRLEG
jgi:cation diffusion facilitator CzcD-associated flavoprotein CzcO